ncbi:MAG: spoIIIJ-associated protein [Epulopiscium sp.]|jgi:spoIIIJ-associated protein|uniref:RNA-binding protein KhpB n=1 Tax=Defluviitalea raffinosedens TaxID=1450156 RepID=A0A7C8LDA2_9FIRM|nr:RNA-binding cell elongation regulator Jag/EloR [Defluviitalea raffinosedens]MBZ4667657.1 jag [Defluviitaleaceae bacterium]MDK2788031.1 spoIIIJ-associated protein [Candidatus Epulonipiscium sp.]KAE9630252.1 KH domain-containing protein [Defluviitalea raffinosedens]MBM7686056.1 spoIIIJ-associated protein [Defluviitalea raffinosedens]HHW67698.1 protein jag [Candidatus Epulonipiscium sp.]
MDFIEKIGKTVEEAITEGLIELGVTRDNVEIEIIEKGSKGFLGIGSKMAKVRLRKKYNPINAATKFLEDIFEKMNIQAVIDVEERENGNYYFNLRGEDMGILIGKRGQTLDSLQYLVNLVANKEKENYVRITLDTENYREKRKDTLEALARNLAKKVKATKKSIVLEPMNPYERRIIHFALQNDKFVKTHSEGEEPYRKVVISPISHG